MLKSIIYLTILLLSVLTYEAECPTNPGGQDQNECTCKDPDTYLLDVDNIGNSYQEFFDPGMPRLPTVPKVAGVDDEEVTINAGSEGTLNCSKVHCGCCRTPAITFKYVSRYEFDLIDATKSDCKQNGCRLGKGHRCCQQDVNSGSCPAPYQKGLNDYFQVETNFHCVRPISDTFVSQNGVDLYRCKREWGERSDLFAPLLGGWLEKESSVPGNTLYDYIWAVQLLCNDQGCGLKTEN